MVLDTIDDDDVDINAEFRERLDKYNVTCESDSISETFYRTTVSVGEGKLYSIKVVFNLDDKEAIENPYIEALKHCRDEPEEPGDEGKINWSKISQAHANLWRFVCPAFLEYLEHIYKDEPVKRLQNPDSHTLVRVLSVEGKATVVPSNHKPNGSYLDPISNEFPGVKTVRIHELTFDQRMDLYLHKVSLDGKTFCYKNISFHGHLDRFKLEIRNLFGLPPHPNIMSMEALVEDQEGLICGAIYSYIAGYTLDEVKDFSSNELKKWDEQIIDAIQHLHKNGKIWGDARPGNIIIDGNRNAILIDFNGGFFSGWVEQENAESVEGDLQGLGRIRDWLRGKEASIEVVVDHQD